MGVWCALSLCTSNSYKPLHSGTGRRVVPVRLPIVQHSCNPSKPRPARQHSINGPTPASQYSQTGDDDDEKCQGHNGGGDERRPRLSRELVSSNDHHRGRLCSALLTTSSARVWISYAVRGLMSSPQDADLMDLKARSPSLEERGPAPQYV